MNRQPRNNLFFNPPFRFRINGGTTKDGRNHATCLETILAVDESQISDVELKTGIVFIKRQLRDMKRVSEYLKLDNGPVHITRKHAGNNALHNKYQLASVEELDAKIVRLHEKQRSFVKQQLSNLMSNPALYFRPVDSDYESDDEFGPYPADI